MKGMKILFLSVCCFLIAVHAENMPFNYKRVRISPVVNGPNQHQIRIYARDRRAAIATMNLVAKGREAVKILLRGAKQVPSGDSSTKYFQKVGDFQTALNDFKATKPKPISGPHNTYPFGRSVGYDSDIIYGQAGDRLLRLDRVGETGNPTIMMLRKIDSSHYSVQNIIYTVD